MFYLVSTKYSAVVDRYDMDVNRVGSLCYIFREYLINFIQQDLSNFGDNYITLNGGYFISGYTYFGG